MHISVKTYILLILGIICLLSSWQGVSAHPGDCEAGVIDSEISKTTVSSYGYSESAQSVLGMVQDTVKQTPEQEWLSGLASSLHPVDISRVGAPVIVAILDTGIDKNHEDLVNAVMAEINFTESPTADDVHGHGTHIAGIIAAANDNNLGINGIAPGSQLLNVKVADDKGNCRMSDLVEGIRWAVAAGADIINISIEMAGPSPELEAAIDYAWENGVIIIAAAGNDGNDLPVYPAGYKNCISVTGLRDNGELAPLANYGDWIDAAAPGFDIYSTLPANNYGYKNGTSFAVAYVSGLAAYLLPLVEDNDGDGRLNGEVRQLIIAVSGYDTTNEAEANAIYTTGHFTGTVADGQ